MPLKYQLLASALREQILRGDFPAGSMLPTEQQLCSRFDVSRQTVRAALDCLTGEGLIQRRQGSGSRVLDPKNAPAQPQRTIAIITTNITEYIFPSVLREM